VPDAAAAAALVGELATAGDTILVKASNGVGLRAVAESLVAATERRVSASERRVSASGPRKLGPADDVTEDDVS
jgi:hypothetical protein